MKNIFVGLLILSVGFVACKKNKTSTTQNQTTPTVTSLSGSYKISKVAAINGAYEMDVTNSYFSNACSRDDVYKLNTNLTYELIDAGVACSPPGNKTGTWSLPTSSTIVIDGFSGNIRKFDGTNLEVTGTISGVSGVIYYVKQ